MNDENIYNSYYLRVTETNETKEILKKSKEQDQKESVVKKLFEIDETQYKRDIAYSRYIGHVEEQD